MTGTCQPVDSVSPPNENQMAILTAAGFKDSLVVKLGYSSTDNWWSVNNWCLAQGKKLISLEELQCYRSGTTNQIKTGDTEGYCCAEGISCSGGDWSSSITNGKFSPLLTALRSVYGTGYWFWTQSSYGNDSPHSCGVFGVSVYDGRAFSRNTRAGGYQVLCQ